ncbi:MAG: methyltransferase domain-containing protein [Alphaproteobacteria bacterium]|nr:methyltransferase domain-containing protein [Alphaproteobacteria bacterium]
MNIIEKGSLLALNRMLRALVKRGSLVFIDAEGRRREYGDGGAPRVALRLSDPALYPALFLNPELKAGEAYMDGALTIEEGRLRDLLRLFHQNAANLRTRPARRALHEGAKRLRRFYQHNATGRARKNAARHYDLSNDLYRLFLDEGLNYSCAYFSDPAMSLEEAQRAKLRHVASKLLMKPGARVLDIGCGWGAMAFYLAEQFDARVVGITLSTEQKALADQRAAARGLSGKVEFRLADYREIGGRFDRIVSIGMFEHVGVPYYDVFFRKIHDLLAEDGVALLHAIGRKDGPDVTGAWIRKYIFPGGYSPSLSEVFAAVERRRLWVTDVEILRMHYAQTLREWSRRFEARRDEAQKMFDERFCRMWEFYLTTSEFAFRHGGHMVFQMQMAKSVDAVPLTRDYLGETERSLAARDSGPPRLRQAEKRPAAL